MVAIIKEFRIALCILVVLPALVLTGCIVVDNDKLPSPLAGNDITISTCTVGRVRQLAIGLADTDREEYTDASGKTQHRLVARLALHLEEPAPVEKSLEVHVGQTIEFQDYTLYVKEISAGGIALMPGASTGHVRLIVGYTIIEKAEPPPSLSGTEIAISTGTQGIVEKLDIGLMYTKEEDYTDASGKTLQRLVAGLSLQLEEPSSVQQYMDVHAGQTIEFQNNTLYVKEISAGGIALMPGSSTGHIVLLVQSP